jgi:gas vesicle protein
MADTYDRTEMYGRGEDSGGGGFMLGFITGTVLGAGIGLLFAPKSGAELRSQLTTRAGDLADAAAKGYRQASDVAADVAGDLTDRGRDIYNRTRDVVSKTADEAERYARDTAAGVSSSFSGKNERG